MASTNQILDRLETFHTIEASDAATMAGMREALAPIKGTIDGPAARGTFDDVMEHTPDAVGVAYEKGVVAGVRGVWCFPADKRDGAYILYCHGGAYVLGSAWAFRHMAGQIAARARAATFIPDYGLGPERPFPAGLQDVQAVYQDLGRHEPRSIIIAGDSAGGGLALVLFAWANEMAKSKNLIAPQACLVISPWTDLSLTGASMTDRADVDPLVTKSMLARTAALYLDRQPSDGPLASPLYGNLVSLPPVQIHVGEDEVLLDDSRRYAQRAAEQGTEVSLHVWQGMPHVFPSDVGTLLAADKALDIMGEFLSSHLDVRS